MDDQVQANIQSLPKYAVQEPNLTLDEASTNAQQSRTPLDYETASELSLCSPFPLVMNAYYQWTSFITFNLCGENENDRLYLVAMHTGLSKKKPLVTVPGGLLLHSGMSKKDPLLAAAGSEAKFFRTFNNNSVILLPPLEPRNQKLKREDMVTEIMQGRTTGCYGVAFRFAIDVGEKMHRVSFEWRKIKIRDEESDANGFRLVRISTVSNDTRSGISDSSNSSQGCSSSFPKENEEETLALLI